MNFYDKKHEIINKIDFSSKNIIIIDGYMSAGKTPLANILKEDLQNCLIINLDDYFKEYHNFDDIVSNELNYDHLKLGEKINKNSQYQFIIIEGINSKNVVKMLELKLLNNYELLIINLLSNNWIKDEEKYGHLNKKEALKEYIKKEKETRIKYSKEYLKSELTPSLNQAFLTNFSQFKNYFKFKGRKGEVTWISS